MTIDETTTREQFGAIVCEALNTDGHYAVLVGGSVLDRLTSFLHHNDRQCLRQAVEVAFRCGVSLDVGNEPGDPLTNSERFADFRERLAKRKQRR